MKLRGIVRAATAVAVTTLVVGGFGAPARAEDGGDIFGGLGGAVLTLDNAPVFAATAPTKGCAGIGNGSPVPDVDGWLYSKPDGDYEDLQYIFLYITGTADEPTGAHILWLNSDGITEIPFLGMTSVSSAEKAAKQLAAKAAAKAKNATTPGTPTPSPTPSGIPTVQPPQGVDGKLTSDGGWVRTPAGWGLFAGFAAMDPTPEGDSTFDLLRVCLPGVAPSTSPSTSATPQPSASATAGPSLPVTGTNVWMIGGAGAAMIVVGAALFMAYRRRKSVKFVA